MAEKQATGGGLITAANALTFVRLVLLPFIIFGIATNNGWFAVIAMAVALLTDLADGRVARRLGQASEFGKTLDSTIDFVFIYALFIALYAGGQMQTNQFIIIYLSMLSILTLQLFATAVGAGDDEARTKFGKPAGAFQYLYLLWLVAAMVLPDVGWTFGVHNVLFVLVGVTVAINSSECVQTIERLSAAASPEAEPAEPSEDAE